MRANGQLKSESSRSHTWEILSFTWLVGHFLFGLALARLPSLGSLHGFVAFGLSFALVMFARRPGIALMGLIYLACSDVVWRMSSSAIPWEGGKYAAAIVACLLALRERRLGAAISPGIYLLILLLGIPIALSFDVPKERELINSIRFTLAGPVCLCVCAMAFGGIVLKECDFRNLLLAILGPIIVVSAFAFFNTYSANEITFTEESNFVTSGGFGPNQVSSILSLGALTSLLLFLSARWSFLWGALLMACCCGFATQSALTFSRGGIYMFAIAALFAFLGFIRVPGVLGRSLSSIGLIAVVSVFIAIPFLVDFTGGMFLKRFQDTSSTGRADVLMDELAAVEKFPFLGVGPGASRYVKGEMGLQVLSHNEFTRVLLEHGFIGVLAFLLVLGRAVLGCLQPSSHTVQTIMITFCIWSGLSFFVNGFRIGAPAVLVVLGYLNCVGSGMDGDSGSVDID